MALSRGDIALASKLLEEYDGPCSHDDEFVDFLTRLQDEVWRLDHGPYTLAEAVASGRPFRRINTPYWCRKAPGRRDLADGEPQFEFYQGFNKWDPAPSVCDPHGFPVSEEWLSVEDIVECDYELAPEGLQ